MHCTKYCKQREWNYRFQNFLAKPLIGKYTSSSRNTPVSYVSRREVFPASASLHLPVLPRTRGESR